ncbi:hypothetical protein BKA83DRAFT_4125066 [Pisolithus microcarpus]|nr:hypothetical protein BKA83DRAFT_4125066 [Pisolithus microcarpus]
MPWKKSCTASTSGLDAELPWTETSDFGSKMQEGSGIGGMDVEAGFVEDFTATFGFCGQAVVILATHSVEAWEMVGKRKANQVPEAGSVEWGAPEIISDSSVVLQVQQNVHGGAERHILIGGRFTHDWQSER